MGWVAHKILVSAPVPLELILTGLRLGLGGLGFGTGLDNIFYDVKPFDLNLSLTIYEGVHQHQLDPE